MGMCSSWSGPGCWAQRRAPWVFSHSSAQLTLAGTLRGKRWRRQEVRAFREGKIEHQQQMVVSWDLVPLPSVSALSPCALPASWPSALKVPASLLCPAPGSWTTSQSSLPLPQAMSFQHSSTCLLCPSGSLPLPAQVPLIPPSFPQSSPLPVLGPRTSWALSPASRDVVGAQPLGSGTSGCCLQVGSRLLRAPLTLATPTYPRPSRGRGREEERESERDEEQELRSFLLG